MKSVLYVSIAAAGLLALGSSTLAEQPAAGAGRGRGAAEPTPAAPPPGSPAIFKSNTELTEALKQALARATPGAQTSANVANTDQYRINLVHRTQGATPLTHAGNTELH